MGWSGPASSHPQVMIRMEMGFKSGKAQVSSRLFSEVSRMLSFPAPWERLAEGRA